MDFERKHKKNSKTNSPRGSVKKVDLQFSNQLACGTHTPRLNENKPEDNGNSGQKNEFVIRKPQKAESTRSITPQIQREGS